jgi:SAM-dependent methyltransferase
LSAITNRQNLVTALEGEKPQRIPYTIYARDFGASRQDPDWTALFDAGLCAVRHESTVREETPHVEHVEKEETWRGQPARRLVWRTEIGEISQLSAAGWVQEYFLKTPADYHVIERIVRGTRLILDPQAFEQTEAEIGDDGITLIWGRRSPMQTILVDFAGLEHFAFHLNEGFPEFFALAEALEEQLLEICRLIAAGPGRYVSLLENLTAETWGARRYQRFHMPLYEKILPILHSGGKKVYAHYDGQRACLAEWVARTELDGIESLTQAPEGDLSYGQARAAWPEKFLWGNLNVSLYDLPPAELRRAVRQMARAGAPDGRLLALEVSEDLPRNWRESLPVVLEELNRWNY